MWRNILVSEYEQPTIRKCHLVFTALDSEGGGVCSLFYMLSPRGGMTVSCDFHLIAYTATYLPLIKHGDMAFS